MAWSSKIVAETENKVTIKVTAEPGSTTKSFNIPWSMLTALTNDRQFGRKVNRDDVIVEDIKAVLGTYSVVTGKGTAAQDPMCRIVWTGNFTGFSGESLVIATMPGRSNTRGSRQTIGLAGTAQNSPKDFRKERKGYKLGRGTRGSKSFSRVRLRGDSFGKVVTNTGETNAIRIDLGAKVGNAPVWGSSMGNVSLFKGGTFCITFSVDEQVGT